MATAAKADAATEPAPKKKKMLPIIIVAAAVVAGGGGGAWYFMKAKADDSEHAQEAHSSKKARVFLPIDSFTVNLGDELNRFAQVGMTLEVLNNEVAEQIKVAMPAVRDRILRLIASKSSTHLLSSEGKGELAEQIGDAVAGELGWEDMSAEPVRKKTATKATTAKAKGKPDADPHDDEDDADDKPSEKNGKGGAKGKAGKSKAHAGKASKASAPHPVTSVHFTQFIVQ
jgi:flagellar protein FliL